MPDFITINKCRFEAGDSGRVDLSLARLPTHTSIDVPVLVYRAMEDGPVLLLTGGLHGDEVNGIEIVRRMIEDEIVIPDRGSVIAIPVVNVYGFIQAARGVPDGKDINRSFPGVKTGSLARLLAWTIMKEIIPQIDCGIDFHTGGASRSNYPQVRCSFKSNQALELARAFAPPVILNSGLIKKSFRNAAHQKGKPILVYEAGESMRLHHNGTNEAIDGTIRLMKHLGMKEEAPEADHTEEYERSVWVRAKSAGLFLPKVSLGDKMNRKQVFGYIKDPYGEVNKRVDAPRSGRIIGINNCPVIHKGDALIHFAYNH